MQFNITPTGNLVIATESEQEKDDLYTMLEQATHKDHGFLADLLEYTGWQPNGRLYRVSPEDIGALTDAPILTDEVAYEEDGTMTVTGKVWWFENYQVESFAETLIKTGQVVFQKAPEEAPDANR